MTCPIHTVDFFGHTHANEHVELSLHPDCTCHMWKPWKHWAKQPSLKERKTKHIKAHQKTRTAAAAAETAKTAIHGLPTVDGHTETTEDTAKDISDAKKAVRIHEALLRTTRAAVREYDDKKKKQTNIDNQIDQMQKHIDYLQRKIDTSKSKLMILRGKLKLATQDLKRHETVDDKGKTLAQENTAAFNNAKIDLTNAKRDHADAKQRHRTVKTMYADAIRTQKRLKALSAKEHDLEALYKKELARMQSEIGEIGDIDDSDDAYTFPTATASKVFGVGPPPGDDSDDFDDSAIQESAREFRELRI